ncbi:MAG: hypothetical protein ACKVJQ_06190 [Alphaproteobacteria bacterium]|jgi:hypothetical protein
MASRRPPPRIPKIREHAIITLGDATVLTGHVFIEATTRIQDLLNGPEPFFAFINEEDEIRLLNKQWVVQVRPFDKN